MKVLSVNTGQVRELTWDGETRVTAIVKEPAAERLRVRRLGLEGDVQANREVHGGPDKAVYVYPFEYYSLWQRDLGETSAGGPSLEWGAFGENLTVTGLADDEVLVGDRLAVGSTVLEVTLPRVPCVNLNTRHRRVDLVERLVESARTGFYCSVVREGDVGAGDAIVHTRTEMPSLSVKQFFRAYTGKDKDPETLQRALGLPSLPEKWRRRFERCLHDHGIPSGYE